MAGTLNTGGGRRGGGISGINVTPMVDVVLVLLIILMVSSTYIVSQTLKVQLPKSKTTDGTADNPATITLLKNGTLRWNDREVTEEQAKKEMADAVVANPETNLVVSADQEVQHGSVVHILDVAKQAGVVKFAINVRQQ
jgi:biopolymer transport protein ExbD